MTALLNPYLFGAADPVGSVSHVDNAVSSANNSAYTFSSMSFGDAHAARTMILTVNAQKSGSSVAAPTVTIDGNSMNVQVTSIRTGTNDGISCIFTVDLASGTSGDVVVTFASTMLRCGVSLYRALNINDTANATDTDTTTGSLSANVSAGGIAITTLYNNNTAGCTWSGVTEDLEEFIESPGKQSTASSEEASASTPLNVTLTTTFGNGGCSAMATFDAE